MSRRRLETIDISVNGKSYCEVFSKSYPLSCHSTSTELTEWRDFDFLMTHLESNTYPWIYAGETVFLKKPCIVIKTRYQGTLYVTKRKLNKYGLRVRKTIEPIWTFG